MPYYCETVEGVEIWFHPLQGQWSLKTFDPVISSYNLSAVRHMVKLSVWLDV